MLDCELVALLFSFQSSLYAFQDYLIQPNPSLLEPAVEICIPKCCLKFVFMNHDSLAKNLYS